MKSDLDPSDTDDCNTNAKKKTENKKNRKKKNNKRKKKKAQGMHKNNFINHNAHAETAIKANFDDDYDYKQDYDDSSSLLNQSEAVSAVFGVGLINDVILGLGLVWLWFMI